MPTRRILLASAPKGVPAESDFRLETIESPTCPEGGILVRTTYISVDPYMRGRISGRKTYIDPILPGDPMVGGTIGEVIESKDSAFQPGDLVAGTWSWQEVIALPPKAVRKLPTSGAPPSAYLGILGVTGLTAYFGLLEVCNPQPGETLVVSGAAGAVGTAVGQIGKIRGCRVVGIASSQEKLDYIRSLGFDAAISYKAPDLADQLKAACPDGVDCYFDNVGGVVTDTVFPLLKTFARVSVCGQISLYNDQQPEPGPRLLPLVVVRQLKIEGYIVTRWAARWGEGIQQLARWFAEGKLAHRETVYEGFENTPKAFIGLFHGENIGKAVVKL